MLGVFVVVLNKFAATLHRHFQKQRLWLSEQCTVDLAKAWIVVDLYLYVSYTHHCFVVGFCSSKKKSGTDNNNNKKKSSEMVISFLSFHPKGVTPWLVAWNAQKSNDELLVIVALLWWSLQMWYQQVLFCFLHHHTQHGSAASLSRFG